MIKIIMITNLLDKIIGTQSQRFIKKFQKTLNKINELENFCNKLSGDEIRKKISEIKIDIEKNKNDLFHLPMVFALVREAAKRTIGHRHYDVQILGGIALYYGYITEMNTGEGKTLVATTATVLRAIQGPVHVITVNSYLAERDAKFMGKIYEYLNISSGYINESTSYEEETAIFSEKSIVYVSNSKIVFFYLRHLLRSSNFINYRNRNVECKFPQYTAIVDEMDMILITEANTPFIISGNNDETIPASYEALNLIVEQLDAKKHLIIDFKHHNVFLTDEGSEFITKILQKENIISQQLYADENILIIHTLRNLLKAHYIFRKDIEYTIIDKKIIIIDEHTGRLSYGRRYSRGLHQALEAKEKLKVEEENSTLLSITYPSFFKEYKFLCGMTGTASPEKEEFLEIYRLSIIKIPPHRPNIRKDNEIRLYKNREFQMKETLELIEEKHKKGQPILIITTNTKESEQLTEKLYSKNLSFSLLNAKNHEKEAEIIANAGQKKAITIATNMAGRGTDILLGGNVNFQIEKILLTSSEENENFKEEEKEEDFLPEILNDIHYDEVNLSNSKKKKIKELLISYEKEKKQVKELGGLVVILFGTPEEEKIQLQAIGRAGRQGDPGESHSFFSIEDDVFLTSFQNYFNQFIIQKIYGENETYISGGPVLSTIRRLWGVIKAQHFRHRQDLNKYEEVKNDQRKDFFHYRDIILSKSNSLQLCNKIFDIFLKEDFLLYSKEDILKHFEIEINNEEELSVLFFKNLSLISLDDLSHLLLLILDDVWKEHISLTESIQYGSGLAAYAQKDPFHEFNVSLAKLFVTSLKNFRINLIKEIINFNKENKEDKVDNLMEKLLSLIKKQTIKK